MALIRPFSGGKRFSRFWDKLELTLDEACSLELAADPSLHQGSLFVRLRDRFTLNPISVGRSQAVTISHIPAASDSADQLPYVVTARIPFFGSKVLLQTVLSV